MRRKKNLHSRIASCSAVHITQPENYKGKWLELCPRCSSVFLELGCGKGRFTVETAAKYPDILFVALEKVPDALVIAMEQAMVFGLDNVFFIYSNADFLSEYFEENELSGVYINFCDPWPTDRHAKRRLTSPRFLSVYKSLLKDEGEVLFKTDNLQLFEYSIEQFDTNGFDVTDVTRNLHENGITEVMTDYEIKFHELGMPICRCKAVFKKTGD